MLTQHQTAKTTVQILNVYIIGQVEGGLGPPFAAGVRTPIAVGMSSFRPRVRGRAPIEVGGIRSCDAFRPPTKYHGGLPFN